MAAALTLAPFPSHLPHINAPRPGVLNRDWYCESRERINDYLRDYLTRLNLAPALRDAMGYALLAPCKRLRAVVAIESCRLVGGDGDAAFPAAAAVEMVHCFSLIHDDLPCMDDSDLRRGRPSLHRHTSEALAVLAGDALFNGAFDVLTNNDKCPGVLLSLCRELVGANSLLANGQALDISLPSTQDSAQPERVVDIHNRKTGGLFRAAARMGAICGRAAKEELEALTHFGDRFGLLYQVVDDILDVTASAMAIGKPVGRDAALGRTSFPGVYGIDGSRRAAATLHTEARAALARFGSHGDRLKWLADTITTLAADH